MNVAKEVCDVDGLDFDFKFSLNTKNLQQAFNSFDSDIVFVYFNSSTEPFILSNEEHENANYIHLVMPIQVTA